MLKKKAYLHFMGKYGNSSDPEEVLECQKLCRTALREYPGDIDIEYTLGSSLNKTGEFAEAWEIFQRCEKKLVDAEYIEKSDIVSAKPWVLFIQMAIAAQGLGDPQGIIRYSTMVLSEDNSHEDVLRSYIKTLLVHDTSEDDVIGLLERLYNFSNPKDVMFLARAAKDCGAIQLARSLVEMAQQTLRSGGV